MTKYTIYLLFLLLAFTAITGCNSDIFIEDTDLPEIQDVMIEGDGGEATFTIPTKHLEHIGFDLMSTEEQYCKYYNARGELIDSKSPASEVHRIVFETMFTKLELIKEGARLTIRSICQTDRQDTHWTIRIEYNYGVRFIELTCSPGTPIRLIEVIYNDDMITDDRAKVTSFRDGFTNNGPLQQTFIIHPYLNELASILVEPYTQNSWIQGERFNMPVPLYVGGKWVIQNKDGIEPGSKYTYEGPDRFTKVEIDAPPYSHISVFTDVIYSGARVTGHMVFHNEVLDLTFSEDIKVTSLYPIGHEIRIEDAN